MYLKSALNIAQIPFLKSKFHSMKRFAIYTAPTEKYWPEITRETYFYKMNSMTCYGHSLKGTNGL